MVQAILENRLDEVSKGFREHRVIVNNEDGFRSDNGVGVLIHFRRSSICLLRNFCEAELLSRLRRISQIGESPYFTT